VVEIHDIVADADGVRRMVPLTDLTVPAAGVVTLGPGGRHLMLLGLHRPLVAGERIALTLDLTGGALAVDVPVRGGP
jgi:periplasmic copper chaperone A